MSVSDWEPVCNLLTGVRSPLVGYSQGKPNTRALKKESFDLLFRELAIYLPDQKADQQNLCNNKNDFP